MSSHFPQVSDDVVITDNVESEILGDEVPPPPEEQEIVEPITLDDDWVGIAPPPPEEKQETKKEKNRREIITEVNKKGDKGFVIMINSKKWKLILMLLPQD